MANFLIQGQITQTVLELRQFWNSDSSGLINSILELIRALVFIYILTKFGDDWLIFVDARMLTSKLWTDGRRMDGWTPTDGE